MTRALRIASFTSIPPRFETLDAVCTSLLEQTVKFDRIILNIPQRYARFPEWDGRLPKVPDGIEVNSSCRDFGPATKILPVARRFADTNALIFHCDDDRRLPTDHVARFFSAAKHKPEAVIAASTPPLSQFGVRFRNEHGPPFAKWGREKRTATYRLQRAADLIFGRTRQQGYEKPWRVPVYSSGYGDIAEGLAGVLVRASFFDTTAFDIPPDVWTTDDIWLSSTYARQGIPIWNPGDVPWPKDTDARDKAPLFRELSEDLSQFDAHCRSAHLLAERFGIWGGEQTDTSRRVE